jgi:hypothetical protein
MLIRTLTRAAGRLAWQPNQIVDLDPSEARQLIQAGAAIAVAVEAEVPMPAVEVPPAIAATPAGKPPQRKQRGKWVK